jgi:hypothetical protein
LHRDPVGDRDQALGALLGLTRIGESAAFGQRRDVGAELPARGALGGGQLGIAAPSLQSWIGEEIMVDLGQYRMEDAGLARRWPVMRCVRTPVRPGARRPCARSPRARSAT